MNHGIPDNHPSIEYYDSDYPSPFGVYPENFDEATEFQGLVHDLDRYEEIVTAEGGPVLELCCGTGRVSIPIARKGVPVTSVDISPGMLKRFRASLVAEKPGIAERITLVEQDVTKLSLPHQEFKVAILAFNSLLCITDFADQRAALQQASKHLASNGLLIVDAINPLLVNFLGDSVPKPFYTRRSTTSGNPYTRFAATGAMDEQQCQELFGWYDEMDAQGVIRRKHYSMHWRPIFRFELELMLQSAGFAIETLEGGHLKETFTARSPRMFIQARKQIRNG